MKCPKCSKGKLRVLQTFSVGGVTKFQERRCDACMHTATSVVLVLDDERSAYKLAAGMQKGDVRVTAAVKKTRREG